MCVPTTAPTTAPDGQQPGDRPVDLVVEGVGDQAGEPRSAAPPRATCRGRASGRCRARTPAPARSGSRRRRRTARTGTRRRAHTAIARPTVESGRRCGFGQDGRYAHREPRVFRSVGQRTKQAAQWPGAFSSSGGDSTRHRGSHERAARLEPAARSAGSTGWGSRRPARCAAAGAAPAGRGSARSRAAPRCTGAGCARRPRRSAASSTSLPAVEDRDPVRDVAHDRQVVGDEQVGQPELVLQVLEQVDHLAPAPTRRAPTPARRRR